MGWAISLRDEGDEGFVNAFEAKGALMKSMAEIVEVLLDNRPPSFQKLITKTIWSRRFIIGQIFYNTINFLIAE